MIPSNRIATHPGLILLKEFLEPLDLSSKDLALHIRIPVQSVDEIIDGEQNISPKIAWLLSQAFETTPEFWLNLQAIHDLSANRPEIKIKSLIDTVSS
jgi:antitoxin HigA-1